MASNFILLVKSDGRNVAWRMTGLRRRGAADIDTGSIPIAGSLAAAATIAGTALGALATTWMTDMVLRRVAWADDLPPLAWRVERSFFAARVCGAALIGLVCASSLPPLEAAATSVFGWAMLALAWIDLRKGVLPDVATGVTAVAGLGWALASGDFVAAVAMALAGGSLGFVILAAVAALYRRARGVDGLGGGDARLLGAIGIWVGWQGIAPVLLGAALLGLALAGALRLAGRGPGGGDAVPFGPFLCICAWLVLIWRMASGEGVG